MKKRSRVCLLLGLLACAVTPAGATPIIVNGGWQQFGWSSSCGEWDFSGGFDFESLLPTDLKVTDTGVDGDRFEVYDGGILLGPTSVPADDGAMNWLDFDAAFADPRWSSGEYLLGPGAHSIAIKIIQMATGWCGGLGGLRVDAVEPPHCGLPVPVPAAAVLAALGAGLLASLRRRSIL